MASKRLRREFLWAGQRLADPDPSMTPEEVRDYYAELYPELTTAAVTPLEEADGKATFSLQKPQTTAVAKAGSGGGSTYQFETSQGKRG